MDPTSASTQALQDTDDYLLIDPRAGRTGTARPGAARGVRQSYAEAMVFVVGGGSYVEYGNLGEWAARSVGAGKRITYGATEIVEPGEFLKSLGALARAAA